MNARFTKYVHGLQPKLNELLRMKAFKMNVLPKDLPKAGIYLFSQRRRHLYVGRSSNIRRRLRNHCRRNHNAASFAFLLARDKTGNHEPSCKKQGSRSHLMRQKAFRVIFFSQIERVKRMDVRFVEEPDAKKRMLLEAYVAITLNTRYDKFEET